MGLTNRLVLAGTVVLTLCAVMALGHQPSERSSRGSSQETAAQMEARGVLAMQAGDWAQGEQVFRALIEKRPESYVGHYNLAAALSRQGKIDPAIESITQALLLGFTDRRQLERDPDLAKFREHAFFTELMNEWPAIVDARHDADLERMNQLVRSRYMEHRTVESLRLEVVSAHDPVSTDQAVEELELIAAWLGREVFVGLERTLGMGGGDDSPWVMVGLPERAGFGRWAIETFGPGVRGNFSSVGGAYEHQQRRLVAQDLGATLRHESVHVLHWRDMTRIGQQHAPWVQEGLASVVEDFDVVNGRLVPAASWRTNMVKRLVNIRGALPLQELASMDLSTFTNRKPLARYAQARTVMMWLLDRGELGEFYLQYIDTYSDDQAGMTALLETTGIEAEEIDRVYQDWVRELEEVPETGEDLEATLGISIENGTGDGVVIKAISLEARRRTGLKLGVIITGIEGRPTRDLHELIRVLGSYKPSQSVRVQWRRGRIHGENLVELLAK